MEQRWENCRHGRSEGPRRTLPHCHAKRGRPLIRVASAIGPASLCDGCQLFGAKDPAVPTIKPGSGNVV
jgi:hypothetical protein